VHSSSGKSVKRKSKISKRGNKFVRKLLFMTAMRLSRKEGRFKDMYEKLLSKGKSKKSAYVAIMRKTLLITRALYKNMTFYKEDYNYSAA